MGGTNSYGTLNDVFEFDVETEQIKKVATRGYAKISSLTNSCFSVGDNTVVALVKLGNERRMDKTILAKYKIGSSSVQTIKSFD